ncbi:hypothetical protein CYY_000040 [Polysphondylium violaceum]|uniref:Uncharacterized protein n=1 Tax=Polysphondylium violaceum TaxID=133409 RepID=A0A8J4Q5G0_9MYCE|nr:hypothetical protein CYY_000040 [Polysphondylium violaceum]
MNSNSYKKLKFGAITTEDIKNRLKDRCFEKLKESRKNAINRVRQAGDAASISSLKNQNDQEMQDIKRTIQNEYKKLRLELKRNNNIVATNNNSSNNSAEDDFDFGSDHDHDEEDYNDFDVDEMLIMDELDNYFSNLEQEELEDEMEAFEREAIEYYINQSKETN